MAPSEDTLSNWVGHHIRDVCPRGVVSDAQNHCAHFVSHVLGFEFGTTCRSLSAHHPGDSATIRVQDLFANCDQVGKWDSLPTPRVWGLVFITNLANVDLDAQTMRNVPRKHVGIFIGGQRTIYQYKNRVRQVVRQTPEEFGQHYEAPDNAMFWGSINMVRELRYED
jgi:hypothetical protein